MRNNDGIEPVGKRASDVLVIVVGRIPIGTVLALCSDADKLL